jgi:hypothetical protein
MRRREDAIQRAVFQHLAIRGARDCFAFHVPNGGWRSPTEAAIMKGIGVRTGIPDIVVVRGGRFYGLELKAHGRGLSPAQRHCHTALIEAGAEVAEAVGLDAALAQLERWKLLHGRSVRGQE